MTLLDAREEEPNIILRCRPLAPAALPSSPLIAAEDFRRWYFSQAHISYRAELFSCAAILLTLHLYDLACVAAPIFPLIGNIMRYCLWSYDCMPYSLRLAINIAIPSCL